MALSGAWRCCVLAQPSPISVGAMRHVPVYEQGWRGDNDRKYGYSLTPALSQRERVKSAMRWRSYKGMGY